MERKTEGQPADPDLILQLWLDCQGVLRVYREKKVLVPFHSRLTQAACMQKKGHFWLAAADLGSQCWN